MKYFLEYFGKSVIRFGNDGIVCGVNCFVLCICCLVCEVIDGYWVEIGVGGSVRLFFVWFVVYC